MAKNELIEINKTLKGILAELKKINQSSACSDQPSICDEEELYEAAKEVIVKAKKASASLLQRKLRIGYARAARLMDILEDKKMIGPENGDKPRIVYKYSK